jgi:hypothetical protein
MAWLPAQFGADPLRVDGVAPVMAWPVGHRCDQARVGGACGSQLVHQGADGLHHLLVGALPMATDAVAAPHFAAGGRQQQGFHVVLHVEPVAHVGPIAVERNRLTGGGLEDHHWDQLLWELPGAVVVAAVGEHHRQPVGVVPGLYQVVAARLAGGVGAARVVGGGLREPARGPQGAEHLIGADVVEAEQLPPLRRQPLPVGPHRLQQVEGALHIALDEGPRPTDRAIHMALGRQMEHQIRISLAHRRRRGLGMGQIHPQQLVPALHRRAQLSEGELDAGEIAGVAELVEVAHRGIGVPQQPPHQRPADEAGSAGHQHPLNATG